MKATIIFTLILIISAVSSAQSVQSSDVIPGVLKNESLKIKHYPEPFSDYTTIEFTIKTESFARIFVTDLYGNNVDSLVNGEIGSGIYSVIFKPAKHLPNGVYICKMETFTENGILINSTSDFIKLLRQ